MRQLPNASNIWESLKSSKNLLAFSGGVDSSALFYMLLQNDVEFDIAIVDYNLRAASKDEVAYAHELAGKYKKRIFTKSVKLENSNFEANARSERYAFFDEIIKLHGYTALLSAHHLGDRLEWFFMRLVRGSGAVELCGSSQIEERENYRVVRPLFEMTKEELLAYLNANGYKYFVDKSNFDEKYERNRWRKNFSEPLLREHKSGILSTLRLLEIDKEKLLPSEYKKIKSLYFFKRSENEIRLIAKIAKFFGIVLSQKQRVEIERQESLVISGKIAIGKNEKFVFAAPYDESAVMDKKFKEACRVAKIPTHIRGYLFSEGIDLTFSL